MKSFSRIKKKIKEKVIVVMPAYNAEKTVAKTFKDLIDGLPIRERKKFEQVIADPETGKAIATMIGGTEAKSEISKQEKK